MPIPDEFVKKREEVTVKKIDFKEMKCRRCGATLTVDNIVNGVIKCQYCGATYTVDLDL